MTTRVGRTATRPAATVISQFRTFNYRVDTSRFQFRGMLNETIPFSLWLMRYHFSYQMEMIESVRCDEEVEKELPDCEHRVMMPCSQDPEDYRCVARCGELMACCGKSCNATCDDCQSVNSAPEDGYRTKRIKHAAHACQKRLYCEHPCQAPCAEEHKHTTRCTSKCRQVCPHAQCKRPCSVPCAPCKQPCTW